MRRAPGPTSAPRCLATQQISRPWPCPRYVWRQVISTVSMAGVVCARVGVASPQGHPVLQNRSMSPALTPRQERRGSSEFLQVCTCTLGRHGGSKARHAYIVSTGSDDRARVASIAAKAASEHQHNNVSTAIDCSRRCESLFGALIVPLIEIFIGCVASKKATFRIVRASPSCIYLHL